MINDDLAGTISKYPDRFVGRWIWYSFALDLLLLYIGLGTLPMNAPTLAVEEIKRAVVDLKFPGFQIGSHIGDWNLDAPELYPVYKVIAKNTHCYTDKNPVDMWRPGCSVICPPLGHGQWGQVLQVLVALVRGNASRDSHCHLLPADGRSSTKVSKVESLLCSWWWVLSLYCG